jgi:Calcium-activated chloride channel
LTTATPKKNKGLSIITMASSLLPLDHLEEDEEEDENEFEPLTPRFSVPSASSSEPQPYSFDDMGHASTYLQFFKSSSSSLNQRHHFPFDAYAVDNTTRTPLQPVLSTTKLSRSSSHRSSFETSPASGSTSTTSNEKVERSNIPKRPVSSYEMSSSSTGSTSEKENIRSIPSASYSLQSTPTNVASTASSYKEDDRSSSSTLWGESFVSVVSRKPDGEDGKSMPSMVYKKGRSDPEQTEYIYEYDRENDVRFSASQGGASTMMLFGLGSLRHPWSQFLFQRILRMPEHFYRRSEIQYLQEQHEWKCQQMRFGISKKDAEEDRRFDFVLILQPQEVYGFWAQRLDFREELLGPNILAGMEEQWQDLLSHHSEEEDADSIIPVLAGGNYSDSASSSTTTDDPSDEEHDLFIDQPTPPYSSTLRRRPQGTPALDQHASPKHLYRTPPSSLSKQPNKSLLRPDASPGLYSYLDKSYSSAWTNRTNATSAKPLSLFERALGSPPNITPSSSLLPESTPVSNNNPVYTYPRKWGNPVSNAKTQPLRPLAGQPPMNTSATPPVQRVLPTKAATVDLKQEDENSNPNCIRLEDIPNPSIARGIAARTNRTHGRLPFCNALRDGGIVVRRHRPGREAVFCRISSPDGGDTLLLQTIPRDEALIAFARQRELHPPPSKASPPQYWSLPDDATRLNHVSDLLPSYGKLIQPLTQLVPSALKGMFSIHMAQVVTIHPASNADPRSANEFGTVTLRRSQSSHVAARSFSLVLQKHGIGAVMEDVKVQWHRGEGNDAQFRYVDLEAATESDYWFILRGLLFLHRDALVGRYAKDRAAGMGTRRLDAVGCDKVRDSVLHVDEFHEPLTVGWLERTIVNVRKLDTTYREGYVTKLDALPPPSDYFLGFRSPGTAIWSRLRQAGLETQRVYSLDPNRVMIKVRCPPDRLMDVAEVLRIKLKTKEGSFAPFREDMMDDFAPMVDPLEDPPPHPPADVHYDFYQFRSSIRQTIIDFIIGSRIRDSGAELGPRDLGQKIQARVPLHVPFKLDAIYASWFYFWKEENWRHGRQGRSLTHASTTESSWSPVKRDVELGNAEPVPPKASDDDDDEGDLHAKIPNLVTRILVGSMFQPLDSIEEYFGEKVAFYFTWLEHTAKHLICLSVAGLILLFFQLGSGKIDHPLRPLFSIVVMIWTFIVLINWKKRANYMAYRWGTMNFKEQETTRPQFIGETTKDEITGEMIITYPKWKRWLKYCISFPLTILFTMGTLILILWVHANRDWQLATTFSDNAHTADLPEIHGLPLSAIGRRGPVVNVELTRENLRSPTFWFIVVLLPSMLGLFLPLLNFLLMRLSIVLNDFENYRTESEYRTYLIIKVFSFRFVCYFATLYYYSILSIGGDASTESGQQAIENGILRVGTGVLVYTTVAQWWQNFVHICFPMLIGRLRMNHRNQRLADELHDIEMEEAEIYQLSTIRIDQKLKERQVRLVNKRLLLEQAQDDIWIEMLLPMHDSFPEYIQAVVQFTFVSCFSVVLPITPLIVLFNYLISMRLDAYKLCRGRRRPISEKTGGIGVWEHVLHIVAVISVLTNCWLMGFLSSQFYWIKEEITEIGLFAVVVVWEHIMLLIKYIMSNSISPLPKTVRDAMKREQYVLDQQRTTLMQERRQQQQQQLNEELSAVMEDPPSQHRLSRHRSKHSRDALSIAESPSLVSSPSFDDSHRHSASTSSQPKIK